MNFQFLFRNHKGRIRTLWRIILFVLALFLAISPLLFIANAYLQFSGAVLILMGVLYLNARYFDKLGIQAYGLIFTRETLEYLLVGLLLGGISVGIVFFIGIATDLLEYVKAGSKINILALVLFAYKMLLVGIVEEVFFRGYVYTTIHNGLKTNSIFGKYAVFIALSVSSLVFGLAHFSTHHASVFSTLILTINGLVWCIPWIITKNLGLSIGQHCAWNFTQTQIGFSMSGNKAINSFYTIENLGPEYLTGGAYGPEAGVLGLMGLLIMLLLTMSYLILKRKFTNLR